MPLSVSVRQKYISGHNSKNSFIMITYPVNRMGLEFEGGQYLNGFKEMRVVPTRTFWEPHKKVIRPLPAMVITGDVSFLISKSLNTTMTFCHQEAGSNSLVACEQK